LAIVNAVGRYQADVTVRHGRKSANAASILELLSLAAPPGTEIVLSAAGQDAREAVQAVARLCAGEPAAAS
jgi:phosphocarrier protein